MNGVPLPHDAPSVAAVLRDAGYRTAIVGKAHFEPFLDVFGRFEENTLAAHGTEPESGAHRARAPRVRHPRAMGPLHYARWLAAEHPEELAGFYPVLDAASR